MKKATSALLIRSDSTARRVKPLKKEFTLEELQGFIGGNIEIVRLPSGLSMVVHEIGKALGLPKNERATAIWQKEFPLDKYPDNNDSLIVGDVVLAEEHLIK